MARQNPKRPENEILSGLLAANGSGDDRGPGNGQAAERTLIEARVYTGPIDGYQLLVVASKADDASIHYSARLTRADGTAALARSGRCDDLAGYEEQVGQLVSEAQRLGLIDPATMVRKTPK